MSLSGPAERYSLYYIVMFIYTMNARGKQFKVHKCHYMNQ